jgi:acyl carrier protein
MTRQEAFDKVIAIIGPYAKNADALKTASDETKILGDLGVNSARLVDIIIAFEDAFDIAIDDDAADKIRTLGAAVDAVLTLSKD